MLVALGLRLLDQDRALEDRRRRELAESTANRAASTLQSQIAALHRLIMQPTATAPADTTLLRNGAGPLLYLPNPPALPEPPAEPFAEPDRLEFQSNQPEKALPLLAPLATSPNLALRAGALLRIARLHRKANRLDAALAAWSQLAAIHTIAIAGEPASLLAHRARCRAFEEAGRTAALQAEAAQLLSELHAARWQLTHDAFRLTSQQATQWLTRDVPAPPAAEAAATALAALWPRRNSTEGALCLNRYTLLWQGDNALLASPAYLAAHWEQPDTIRLTCPPNTPPAGLTLPPALTSLPWNLTVPLTQKPLPEFSSRRTALLAAFAVLFLLISAAAWFTWRAIARELHTARLQSDFVAAVSHEFRTPLTSLRQFNEMLTDEPNLPADVRLRYHRAQSRATDRLHRLVETLLDFGRMEAGRRPYNLEPADAAALTRAVAAEFAAEPAARGFDIQCLTPPHPLPIRADREALARALWNLLDNAVKYSGDNRAVTIEASAHGPHTTIAVTDHGLGIPAHEQPRLFQKFVRGESTRTNGIPGTGIGLAMVRHIAEAHDGAITLRSAEGQGSTFTLTLPSIT